MRGGGYPRTINGARDSAVPIQEPVILGVGRVGLHRIAPPVSSRAAISALVHPRADPVHEWFPTRFHVRPLLEKAAKIIDKVFSFRIVGARPGCRPGKPRNAKHASSWQRSR